MGLDRGGYHVEQTPFPAAFLHVDGQLLPVHATAWNRVDLCNPATGIMITPRRFEAASGQRPECADKQPVIGVGGLEQSGRLEAAATFTIS